MMETRHTKETPLSEAVERWNRHCIEENRPEDFLFPNKFNVIDELFDSPSELLSAVLSGDIDGMTEDEGWFSLSRGNRKMHFLTDEEVEGVVFFSDGK